MNKEDTGPFYVPPRKDRSKYKRSKDYMRKAYRKSAGISMAEMNAKIKAMEQAKLQPNV